MGARLRLKTGKDISGFPPEVQKIFRAMKTYGLIVADNGTDMYIGGHLGRPLGQRRPEPGLRRV